MTDYENTTKKYQLLLKMQHKRNWAYALDHMDGNEKVSDLIRKRPLYADELADMIDEFGFDVLMEVYKDLRAEEETTNEDNE